MGGSKSERAGGVDLEECLMYKMASCNACLPSLTVNLFLSITVIEMQVITVRELQVINEYKDITTT